MILWSVNSRGVHEQLQCDCNSFCLQSLYHTVLHFYPLGDVLIDDGHPLPFVIVQQGQHAGGELGVNSEGSGEGRVEFFVGDLWVAAHLQ